MENVLKRLRNGQRSTLKNQETVSVWKLVIFKKVQRSPLIFVSYNWILRVPQLHIKLLVPTTELVYIGLLVTFFNFVSIYQDFIRIFGQD